ncbi:MAG: hypothetical protein ABSA49_14675 [Rhizomicrobium sp.]|jgi:hypothetical protein
MDKRFPPPTNEQLMTIYARAEIACELALMAADNHDYPRFCAAKSCHDRLVRIFEAMRERQRGATVH